MILTGMLVTIGVQIGVSYLNQKWNSENAEKIRQLQREAKKASQERAIRRDYERFVRSCQFQLKMESNSRRERIENMNQDFLDSFKKMAHNATLASHYPLRISPYIIEKSVLPCFGTEMEDVRQEVLCILTSSNDKTFNSIILPNLDEAICLAIAQFWNKGSLHNICYYQGIWDDRRPFCDEDIDNVKAVVCSPTLTITPYIEKQRLLLKMHLWGVGQPHDITIDTGVSYEALAAPYSAQNIQALLSAICPMILCSIGQMIDVYYWGAYYQAPLLPRLLSKGAISLSDEMRNEIIASYDVLYRSLALGQIVADSGKITTDNKQALEQVTTMNMFNFPDRNIGFLKSCTNLMGISETSGKLIEHTMMALYEANTGQKCTSISNVDVRLLNYDDMKIVSELIDIANGSSNFTIAKRLTDLIVRKIRS